MAIYEVLPSTDLTDSDIRDTLRAGGGTVDFDSRSWYKPEAKINKYSWKKPIEYNETFASDNVFTDLLSGLGIYYFDGVNTIRAFYGGTSGENDWKYTAATTVLRSSDFRGYDRNSRKPIWMNAPLKGSYFTGDVDLTDKKITPDVGAIADRDFRTSEVSWSKLLLKENTGSSKFVLGDWYFCMMAYCYDTQEQWIETCPGKISTGSTEIPYFNINNLKGKRFLIYFGLSRYAYFDMENISVTGGKGTGLCNLPLPAYYIDIYSVVTSISISGSYSWDGRSYYGTVSYRVDITNNLDIPLLLSDVYLKIRYGNKSYSNEKETGEYYHLNGGDISISAKGVYTINSSYPMMIGSKMNQYGVKAWFNNGSASKLNTSKLLTYK